MDRSAGLSGPVWRYSRLPDAEALFCERNTLIHVHLRKHDYASGENDFAVCENNPAYNFARGPVNVFSGRLHLQF